MSTGESFRRKLQGSVSRHGLLDSVYHLREHANNIRLMVSGEYFEGVFPRHDVLRNTWVLGTPNPYNSPQKVPQYTSNFYSNTSPLCIAVPSWLLRPEEREIPMYTSQLLPPPTNAFEKVLGVGVARSS